MKKLLVVLLALTMLVGTLALTSCGARPELDLDDAEDALEDADYYVDVDDDFDDPSIDEKLTAYSDDHDDYITITVYKDTKTAKLQYEKLKYESKVEKEYLEMQIEYYEHILDEYEDDLDSDDIDDLEDELKAIKKQLKNFDEENCIGRSGKTVWYGTKKAIEDTKD